jgi:superfamily II DNA or RNA helicase
MDEKPTIILADKLIVPTHLVPINALSDFVATLKDSDGEDINLQFYEHDFQEGVTRFQRGNTKLIKKHFSKYNIEDQRSTAKMEYEIQFTKELYESQKKVVEIVLAGDGSGVIQAPPRFGKTVVMTYLTCKLGYKTIFVSHQIDLSKQALKTFWKMTNILEVEEKVGRPLAGLVNKWSDLDKFQIAFLPYQKFIKNDNSWEKLKEYSSNFGLVFVDESHRSNAPRYSEVVGSFNSRWRMGVSATPKIKSKMDIVSKFTLGPVIAKGEANQIPCQVRIVKTGVVIPYRCTNIKTFFMSMLDFLQHHQQRNDYIADYIATYARAGHYCIAVSERLNMLDYITKKLKDDGFRVAAFHNSALKTKKDREDVLQKARSGEVQILMANRSMVLGLDIPRLTTFFNLTPSANQPNYYQELSRVRTPYPNKLMSYIIDFVDFHPIAFGCLTTRKKLYAQEGFEVIEM